jgi:hypothetical protein
MKTAQDSSSLNIGLLETEIRRGFVTELDSTVIKFVAPINIEDMRSATKYCAVQGSQFLIFTFFGFAIERFSSSSYPKFFSSTEELFHFYKVKSFESLQEYLLQEQSKYLISLWGRAQDTKNLQTLFFYNKKKDWVFGLGETSIEFWSVLTT